MRYQVQFGTSYTMHLQFALGQHHSSAETLAGVLSLTCCQSNLSSINFSNLLRNCWKSSCINARPSFVHLLALAKLQKQVNRKLATQSLSTIYNKHDIILSFRISSSQFIHSVPPISCNSELPKVCLLTNSCFKVCNTKNWSSDLAENVET
jgi:hypothetical protein